jgi:hypothetical protein
MSERSLPIDALVYRLGESAADLLHWREVDPVPDDWNRGARDHPSHETIGPVHLVL